MFPLYSKGAGHASSAEPSMPLYNLIPTPRCLIIYLVLQIMRCPSKKDKQAAGVFRLRTPRAHTHAAMQAGRAGAVEESGK